MNNQQHFIQQLKKIWKR